MKYIKWALILTLVFFAGILGMPIFAIGNWINQSKTREWSDDIGKELAAKVMADFK